MIGYPLFSFKNPTIHGPTVTYGHISNIFDKAMIVASCASNSGSSGGALVKRNGELVGLISSNVMVEDALVPHLTVVVPFSVFVEPIREFIKTKSKTITAGYMQLYFSKFICYRLNRFEFTFQTLMSLNVYKIPTKT